MTRKKVTLAYITNDSERKASFKKRKKGLIKKVCELSILCGVDACAIIYGQYEPEPTVWPSPLGAQAVLARFLKLSEIDQRRKMVNQESFTRQRIKKGEDQLRRLRKENKRRELQNFVFQCLAGMVTLDDFNLRDAAEMGWVVNQVLREIKSRMDALEKDRQHYHPAAAAEAAVGEDNMESFLWNLVESPTGAGDSGLGAGCGLGWDVGMVLPYPYIFNHANNNAANSGSERGIERN